MRIQNLPGMIIFFKSKGYNRLQRNWGANTRLGIYLVIPPKVIAKFNAKVLYPLYFLTLQTESPLFLQRAILFSWQMNNGKHTAHGLQGHGIRVRFKFQSTRKTLVHAIWDGPSPLAMNNKAIS